MALDLAPMRNAFERLFCFVRIDARQISERNQADQQAPQVSPWRKASLNLLPGMYCEDCIREGKIEVIEDDMDSES